MTAPLHRSAREIRLSKDRRAGFSLLELLTAIAIIAILAAISFPAVTALRLRAQQSQVISNLKAIHQAIGIYKADEGGYPPNLGPVFFGSGAENLTSYSALYPEWVRDRTTFHSPASEVEDPNALYPVDSGMAISRGYIAPPTPPADSMTPAVFRQQNPMYASSVRVNGWNTMDGHVEGENYVPHYSRYRTWSTNDPDFKRQLGSRNPLETTVVTWNDTFVVKDESTGVPQRGDYLVLFLNGTVRKMSVEQVSQQLKAKGFDFPGQQPIWRVEP